VLHDVTLMNFLRDWQFVGLENFRTVLTDTRTLTSLKNTAIFAFASISLQMIIGTAISYLLYRAAPKVEKFFRPIVILPWLCSVLIAAFGWQLLLAKDIGLLNTVITGLGFSRIDFFGGSTTAMISIILANTWWAQSESGKNWFSVTDGVRFYQSPTDAEYGNAFFYLSFWPELLDMLLDEWIGVERDGSTLLGSNAKETAYLAHDMGSHFFTGESCYHHPTPLETNANYLLLLAARTGWSGELSGTRKKLALCRRLAEFIYECDTTGNGLPDRCTPNMLDDATPALQYGRDQTYLGLKAQAALTALADIEEACAPADSRAERWRAFVAKGVKTLDAEGWLGEHYPVTLPSEDGNGENPWTGESLPGNKQKGWDDYSIHTSNGLLYLHLANFRQPHWRVKRLVTDLENAGRRCQTPYGCTHTATCDSAVWFSQNICRDLVAAWLGVDMLNNAERYWDYQVLAGSAEDGALFYDSTSGRQRCFHPGGVSIFGAALAAAGLKLNRIENELILSPIRTTLDVPLLPFADWEQRRVPWLRVRQLEGVATARISNRDLLEGLTIEAMGVELEAT